MILFIKGTLDSVLENSVVVDCNGIGYEVFVSPGTIAELTSIGDLVKIYTYMQVKEDGITLYGFMTMEEIKLFNILITVSGIGPKVALSMLSSFTPADIMLAIITDDINALGKVPGIGKKTAQRLVLELRDKIKTQDAVIGATFDPQQSIHASGNLASGEKQDAIDALLALGYGRSEAVKGVLEVAVEGMTTEQIIKQTLRRLSS